MKTFCILSILFGLVVIGGEVFRSWGERDVIWWVDDFLVGGALIVSAVLAMRETARRRALLTGAWGFAAGIIFISVFDKVIVAAMVGPGAEFNRLNIFAGFSLTIALVGFVASLVLPFKNSL